MVTDASRGLEGVVAKRGATVGMCRAGVRNRQKMRINEVRELVIGGYTLALGHYEGRKLMYMPARNCPEDHARIRRARHMVRTVQNGSGLIGGSR